MSVITVALDFTQYRHKIAVADGDFGEELFLRGWDPDVPIELAALRRGDILRDAVQAFLDAGAEVLTTCSDRANELAWPEDAAGVESESIDLPAANRETVRLFREAVSDYPGARAIVLGSLGPTDAILLLDEADERTVKMAYREQAEALVKAGADGLLFRSFTELNCLEVAIRAAREITDLPIIGSMTFDCGLERTETSLGVTVPQACAALSAIGIGAIGCDGAEDPDAMPGVVSLLREASNLPVWVSLHPGRPELIDGKERYSESPQDFGRRLAALAKAGVSVIGGARGAGTAHIAALAAARERLK